MCVRASVLTCVRACVCLLNTHTRPKKKAYRLDKHGRNNWSPFQTNGSIIILVDDTGVSSSYFRWLAANAYSMKDLDFQTSITSRLVYHFFWKTSNYEVSKLTRDKSATDSYKKRAAECGSLEASL